MTLWLIIALFMLLVWFDTINTNLRADEAFHKADKPLYCGGDPTGWHLFNYGGATKFCHKGHPHQVRYLTGFGINFIWCRVCLSPLYGKKLQILLDMQELWDLTL